VALQVLANHTLAQVRSMLSGVVNPTRVVLNEVGAVELTRNGGIDGLDSAVVLMLVLPTTGTALGSLEPAGKFAEEGEAAIRGQVRVRRNNVSDFFYNASVTVAAEVEVVECPNGEVAVSRTMCSESVFGGGGRELPDDDDDDDDEKGKSSSSATLGIALGVSGAVFVLAALAVVVLRRRQSRDAGGSLGVSSSVELRPYDSGNTAMSTP
jgi:hypothetical protein